MPFKYGVHETIAKGLDDANKKIMEINARVAQINAFKNPMEIIR